MCCTAWSVPEAAGADRHVCKPFHSGHPVAAWGAASVSIVRNCMHTFSDSLATAWALMTAFDPGLWSVVARSLAVSATACALAASALMLGAAHAFETFGGYAPCTLCLRQREVYWVAGSLALAGLVLTRPAGLQRFKGLFYLGLALVFMAGVGIAAGTAGGPLVITAMVLAGMASTRCRAST